MTTEEFLNVLFETFEAEITDKVFQTIEQDPDLMRLYLKQVEEHGTEINRFIGKAVKERYNLENNGIEENPKSILIKTFTKH